MAHSLARRTLVLSLPMLAGLALAGCTDPNAIGVQEYGTVTGHVVDAATNKPVNSAIVSIGSLLVRYTGVDGSFVIPHVPAGTQLISVTANGYATGMASVVVTKGQQTDSGPITVNPLGLPGQVVTPTAIPTSPPGPAATASPSAPPATAAPRAQAT